MQKKMLFLFLYVPALYSGGASLDRPRFEGVFSTQIYDQVGVPQTESQDDLNDHCVQLLVAQKAVCVEDTYIKKLLMQLEKKRDEAVQGSLVNKGAQEAAAAYAGIKAWFNFMKCKVAQIREGSGVDQPTGFERLVDRVANEEPARAVEGRVVADVSGFLQEMRDSYREYLVSLNPEARVAFESERDYILSWIPREWVHKYEVAYVQKKRFFSRELCESIEKKLLSSHALSAAGPSAELFTFWLEKALALPVRPRRIGGDSSRDWIQTLLGQLDQDPCFTIYDAQVQKELKKIIALKIFESRSDRLPRIPRIPYFYGKEDTGKSTAAKLILGILRVPGADQEITVRNAEDFSRENIEGAPLWSPKVNIGWFAEALTRRSPDSGESCTNTGCVINEVDKVWGDPKHPAVTAILDLADPEKEFLPSTYFEAPLFIGAMNIFLTGNAPIPDQDDPQRRFQSLASRLCPVYFPSFSENAKREILERKLSDIYSMEHIRLTPEQHDAVIVRAIKKEGLRAGFKILERAVTNIVCGFELFDGIEEEKKEKGSWFSRS